MVKELGRVRIFAELEGADSGSTGLVDTLASEEGPTFWKLYVLPAWDRDTNDSEVAIQVQESSDQTTWRYFLERSCDTSNEGYAPTPIFGLQSDRFYRVFAATFSSKGSPEEVGTSERIPLGYYVDDSSDVSSEEGAQILDSTYDGTTITLHKSEPLAAMKSQTKKVTIPAPRR